MERSLIHGEVAGAVAQNLPINIHFLDHHAKVEVGQILVQGQDSNVALITKSTFLECDQKRMNLW
jgi:hypothetical protein